MYAGFGQVPTKVGISSRVTYDPARAAKYSAEQKAWCIQAASYGLYPHVKACNEAVAAGAPMTDLTQATATPGSEAGYSNTKLYVGIGIAVVVVGIGAYLITR